MDMHPFFQVLDPYLIWCYRITGHAGADFVLGTLALAGMALIIGEFTISLAFLAVKDRIDRTTAEIVRYQNLSVDALAAGNQEAYRAANKLANDAFGKSFFLQIALSAAFLWPIFFALAWMNYRFSGLEFPIPGTEYSLGFMGVFILIYAAAYPGFKRIKNKLPYFRRIKAILDTYRGQTREMKSFADLHSPAMNAPMGRETGRKNAETP